ncbi:YqaJ domain-containing protein [Aphis craccivora]|uniref:YqaJ domain-containing protein n=1 Tax=Aphis craccivora TaxID=307492 RepID=A0A6G0WD74_APHCR|nr:YqaJ domain-containing protein [Aphis craccivora]
MLLKSVVVSSLKIPDKDYGYVDDIGCSVFNLTGKEVEEKEQNLLNCIQLNLTEIKSLERRTIGQSLNEIWKQERKFRLKALNFG